jgi:hypothetical protein
MVLAAFVVRRTPWLLQAPLARLAMLSAGSPTASAGRRALGGEALPSSTGTLRDGTLPDRTPRVHILCSHPGFAASPAYAASSTYFSRRA